MNRFFNWFKKKHSIYGQPKEFKFDNGYTLTLWPLLKSPYPEPSYKVVMNWEDATGKHEKVIPHPILTYWLNEDVAQAKRSISGLPPITNPVLN